MAKKDSSIEEQLTAALLETEQLKTELANAKQELAEKGNELAAVYQVNEELKAEIEKATANGSPLTANNLPFTTESFELDGIKYGFNFGATVYKGQKITHVEIMADQELQKALLTINAGIIKKFD